MPIYNKLVRDNIPEIIEASGKSCTTRTLSQNELLEALKKKLNEECQEFDECENLEELADICEVLMALVAAVGSDKAKLESVMAAKRLKNGGFEKGIYLVEVNP